MRVAAIGGGHGLSTTLRAARRYADDITAIVSVADDGGSSGRLRQALGIPAPGDLRRCLVALAEDEMWATTFEHRFADGAGDLAGHAMGNLVIAGLAAATGDFTKALDEAGRLLRAVGRVLPATAEPVMLKAHAAAGEIHGQVRVQETGRITSVSLVPEDAPAPPEVVEAIDRADQVILGPGSLFTSVLAAAVVADVRAALRRRTGGRVYVANVREDHPETTGYDIAAHVEALRAHGIEVDVVVAHEGGLPIGVIDDLGVRVVTAPIADGDRHDVGQLATVLAGLVG